MKITHKTLTSVFLSIGLTLLLNSGAKADNHGNPTSAPMADTSETVPITEVNQTSADANNLIEDYEEQPQTVEAFLVDALNLSEEQQNEIREIFADYQPRIQRSFQDYLVALDTLNSALTPATDSRVLIRARDEAVSLERQTYDLMFDRNIAIRDVLNPGQRAMVNVALRDLFDIQPLSQVTPLPFPSNLIGQNATEVIEELIDDGWSVTARTPSLVQLDKDNMFLDLEIDRSGNVDEASLR